VQTCAGCSPSLRHMACLFEAHRVPSLACVRTPLVSWLSVITALDRCNRFSTFHVVGVTGTPSRHGCISVDMQRLCLFNAIAIPTVATHDANPLMFFSCSSHRAMICFLACLKEFGEHAAREDVRQSQHPPFTFPFPLEGDKVILDLFP
jgi:hypothetical protein